MSEETFRFDHPALEILNTGKWILTDKIQQHYERLLEVVLVEAGVSEKRENCGPISNLRAIVATPENPRFVFKFENFASYAITEEMFWEWHPESMVGDTSPGRVMQFSQSPFLDFVRAQTWANRYHDIPLLHFQLVTLDHTIDVATWWPPQFCYLPGT